MSETNAFLKRMVLVAVAGSLPFLTEIASAHGGHGTGGSSGGGSSSSSDGGHSSASTSGGHSSASTSGGHSLAASKGGTSKGDPSNVSQSPVTGHTAKVHRAFVQRGSTGYNAQNTVTENDDWKRRHHRLLFGFIPY
jgi:hypothetical protein